MTYTGTDFAILTQRYEDALRDAQDEIDRLTEIIRRQSRED